MQWNRTASRLLMLLVVAVCGYLLFSVPPKILEQYEVVKEMGSVWVYLYFGTVGLGAAILLGTVGWILWKLFASTRRKKRRQAERSRNPSEMTRDQLEREISDNLATVDELNQDVGVSDELRAEIQSLVDQVQQKRTQLTLEIVAFGTISSGKSSLLNALAGREVFATDVQGGTTIKRNEIPWPGVDRVLLVDTPGLGEPDGEQQTVTAADAAKNADIVLVVVDGPLRESEFDLLSRLAVMEKRVMICLNKEDWYDDEAKSSLLGQLTEQVAKFVDAKDIVAVRSRATVRKRTRLLADGTESEEEVEVLPDIAPLARGMMAIVKRNGQDLLLANLLLQSRGLVGEAKEKVQSALDRRAWATVDKYTWAAAGAAALTPLPAVDLLTGAAISTKLVVDLAQLYRQEVTFDTAKTLLQQLGKYLAGFLGVTLAGTTLTAGIASLLKSIPGAGTIAGGLLQGIVQAIITRWIGAVFVAYFKNEMREPDGGMASLARREWERVTSFNELRKLVLTARQKLTGSDNEEDDA
ncbi:MAG: hypothetical protein CL681_25185 [Blastopirellula sp.]|mgnify:CR=1 FL=1|nr:hypothetical protein [Blastopirellula sp.]